MPSDRRYIINVLLWVVYKWVRYILAHDRLEKEIEKGIEKGIEKRIEKKKGYIG